MAVTMKDVARDYFRKDKGRQEQPPTQAGEANTDGAPASSKMASIGLNAAGRDWFETTFDEHWTRLCIVLFRLVGEWEEAEDLALEAFWRLYSRPPREESNIGGWLYRVGVNLGYNTLRSRRRRKHYEGQAGRIELEDRQVEEPARATEVREVRHQVQMVLLKLPARSAKLLALRYSGLTYKEIAEALKLSPGSIGALLARAEKEFEKNYYRLYGEGR
jgi:RNA polymerase sigma-70 factor, ECF subfamily